MTDASSTAALSDRDWAEVVAKQIGRSSTEDVLAVQQALSEAGIPGPRPLAAQHRARIEEVYFAGVKVIRAVSAAETAPDASQTEEAEGFGSGQGPPLTTSVPFSFHHVFQPGLTVFASDGVNLIGKSAILGVILWGLRGDAPSPTLQGDIRDSWLREAMLRVSVDSTQLLIAWRIHQGRPAGTVFEVIDGSAVDMGAVAEAGLAAGAREIQGASGAVEEGAEAEALRDDASDRSSTTEDWPGQTLGEDLARSSAVKRLATFASAVQFEAAMAGTLMARLELEAIPVWQKRPGAIDEHDAELSQHGWKTVAQAMSIVDPTSRSVLGEHTFATNLLLSLFLGSRWAVPTMVARASKGKADQAVAGRRRRESDDANARRQGVEKLEQDLAAARAAIRGLGKSPSYAEVLVATEAANSDALAQAHAHEAYQRAALAYGDAARTLERAELDLHALSEAAATRRFWHSLRPACCPRCDGTIDEQMWAREREGQCSLCSSDFIEPANPTDSAPEPEVAEESNGDNEDNEDEIVAVRLQVEQLRSIAEEASEQEERLRFELSERREASALSRAALEALDSSAASKRFDFEMRIARLEARVEERGSISGEAADHAIGEDLFAAEVCKGALAYATKQRDAEQQKTLEQVSAIITELGMEFGIRNMVSAKLTANGHLPVVKGDKRDNFGELAPGERLRLRIALVVALLRIGRATGTSRHPGLLIVDDLTTHELNHDDAAAMAKQLAGEQGLQVIAASTYARTLAASVGDSAAIITPAAGSVAMF